MIYLINFYFTCRVAEQYQNSFIKILNLKDERGILKEYE